MREGNSYTNLLKIMKQEGYNKDNDITIGRISNINPLKIEMGKFIIEEGDFFIVEKLTEYTRSVTVDISSVTGNTGTTDLHSHSLEPFQVTGGTITFKQPLVIGDKVLVIIDNNDFYVIDKVVN